MQSPRWGEQVWSGVGERLGRWVSRRYCLGPGTNSATASPSTCTDPHCCSTNGSSCAPTGRDGDAGTSAEPGRGSWRRAGNGVGQQRLEGVSLFGRSLVWEDQTGSIHERGGREVPGEPAGPQQALFVVGRGRTEACWRQSELAYCSNSAWIFAKIEGHSRVQQQT